MKWPKRAERDTVNTAINTVERPYRCLDLLSLVESIAREGDTEALCELLEHRKLFRFEGKGNLVLPDYLVAVWEHRTEQARTRTTLLWDRARDLTLDKFTSIPRANVSGGDKRKPSGDPEPRSRVDCRKYYAALLKTLEKDKGFHAEIGTLERDQVLAVCFQRFVNHHFYLSYLEARRRENPFISRYAWRLDGKGKITLWMPKYLSGKARGAWLKKHVPDPDPKRPGERDRVQAIVDEGLLIPKLQVFEPERHADRPSGIPSPDVAASARMRPSLTDLLAREKAESIVLQRPSIRELGPEKVERLVKIIVPNLSLRQRTDEAIAREFGLSKTAYSHFAGSDWAKGEKTVVSDLWRNLADILSQSEVFQEVAQEAGVWRAVETLVDGGKPAKLKGEKHDQ